MNAKTTTRTPRCGTLFADTSAGIFAERTFARGEDATGPPSPP